MLTHHFTRCALSFEQIGNHFRARHLIDSDFPYLAGCAQSRATLNTDRESMNIITIFHNALAYKFTAWKIKDLHVWSLGCAQFNSKLEYYIERTNIVYPSNIRKGLKDNIQEEF